MQNIKTIAVERGEDMIKAWRITSDVGYGGRLLYNLTNNAQKIPEPLPWIDPSINCL